MERFLLRIFVLSPGYSLATILCPQGEEAGGLGRSEPVGGGLRLEGGGQGQGRRTFRDSLSLGRWLDLQQEN